MGCLTENALLDYSQGLLSEEDAAGVERHLDGCTGCRALVGEWLRTTGGEEVSGPRTELPRGTNVGRYVILKRLGSGAMGVVYAAFDPELDRTVAVKVLRSVVSAALGKTARARLLREAQAMARLSHPNVMVVHDVGAVGERVFLAMEHLEGGTLKQWLDAKPRPYREVLERFLPAGRGLAAAHAQGLVHRDFKPENVMIGRDGRVRVTDFGLVRPAGSPSDAAPPTPAPTAGDDPGEGPALTRAGAVMGTPAYMAPEQLRGLPVDARSDQFSFCVALFEGLYGVRPFSAGNIPGLIEDITARRLAPAPAGSRVPQWLRAVVLRGLSTAPEDRHPSMEALLSELARERGRTRMRIALGFGAVVAAVGLVASSWYVANAGARACGGAEAMLAGAWDPQRKSEVRKAFLASGKPYAGQALATVEASLDAWSGEWVSKRTVACEATRVHAEQPEPVLVARLACFDRRRVELEALTGVFATADEGTVAEAVKAVAALAPVRQCADTERLLARPSPPADGKTRAQVDAVRAGLAAARALKGAAKFREGEGRAGAAADQARASGYRPVLAEALLLHGQLRARAGDPLAALRTLEEAELAAEAAREDELATEASIELARLALAATDYGRCETWLAHGEASLVRQGGSDVLQARLLETRANLLGTQSRYPEAAPLLTRALELKERAFGRDHLEVAEALFQLARGMKDPRERPRALGYARRGLEIVERAFGPEHPDVARALGAVGQLHRDSEQYADELACATRAMAIREKTLGPGHLEVGSSHWSMATAFDNLGDHEQARAHYQAALSSFERVYGQDHLLVATLQLNLAAVEHRLGLGASALARARAALPVHERLLGPDEPRMLHPVGQLATVLAGQRKDAEALRLFERAIALGRKRASDNPDLASPLRNLAGLLLAQGRPAEAQAALEEAIRAQRTFAPEPSLEVAHLEVQLARAVLAGGRPAEALAGVSAARARLEGAFGPDHRLLADALTVEGRAHAALGNAAAAGLLERAGRLREAHRARPELAAETRFALAQVLWANPAERPRAHKLAAAAREGYAEAGYALQQAAVGAWLARHPGAGR